MSIAEILKKDGLALEKSEYGSQLDCYGCIESGIKEDHACCLMVIKNLDGISFAAELSTQLETSTEDGRQKPKLEIVMVKAPTFQTVVDQQAKEQAAKQAALAPSHVEA